MHVPVPRLFQCFSVQEQKEKKIAIIENEFGEANSAISQIDLVCVMFDIFSCGLMVDLIGSHRRCAAEAREVSTSREGGVPRAGQSFGRHEQNYYVLLVELKLNMFLRYSVLEIPEISVCFCILFTCYTSLNIARPADCRYG